MTADEILKKAADIKGCRERIHALEGALDQLQKHKGQSDGTITVSVGNASARLPIDSWPVLVFELSIRVRIERNKTRIRRIEESLREVQP